jgi:hypothetical protein
MKDEYAQEYTDRFQEDVLVNTAQLGLEAQQFFASNIGRLVVSRAEKQIEEAYKALSIVDPDSPSDIRQLQFDIAVARAVPGWLSLVIQDGVVAERQIDEEEGIV